MRKNRLYSSNRQTENGQSTVIVALSLGVLLLLIIGAVVLCVALFTATSMEDYDNGNGIFGIFETQNVGDIAMSDFGPDFSGLEIVSPQSNLLVVEPYELET
jgi:formate hydrogenlyase subunit 3/multisubunit Na+/H+ antiporter MnhD subunit